MKESLNAWGLNLRRLLTAGWLGALPLMTPAVAAPAPKPNIVYFLVDDMGFADCGFNGGQDIRTPIIDALSTQGTVFQNYYVQPVCSTSRACLMTGRYPIRTGIYGALKNNSQYGLPLNERTLPQALHTAGYTTAICGKWHLGDFAPGYLPMQRGFDHQYGLWTGMMDYFTHVAADGTGRRPDWHRDDELITEPGYSTLLIAQEAIRLIQEQAKDKPLFLYVPFNGIHGPYMAPTNYTNPYQNLPPNRQMVAGMLTAVDDAIGQVVAALKAAKMYDHTLIIFSSDNGGPFPGDRTMNTPLRAGKGSTYEGGVRSSAFAIFPGQIPAGKKVSAPVHLVDWYPTLTKLTGADPAQPLPVDGTDIWPLLTQGQAPDRDAILIAGTPRRYALRMGDWKLLVNPGGGRTPSSTKDVEEQPEEKAAAAPRAEIVELYNLAEDLSETKNLAAAQPERVQAMRARLETYMKDAVPALGPLQPKAKGAQANP